MFSRFLATEERIILSPDPPPVIRLSKYWANWLVLRYSLIFWWSSGFLVVMLMLGGRGLSRLKRVRNSAV